MSVTRRLRARVVITYAQRTLAQSSPVLLARACCAAHAFLRAASTVMQYQVLQGGLPLFGLPLEAGLFECFILSEKTALDEARRGLLADIYQEGRVYAG